MENSKELNKDSERRKLQEDIERLQDIIGDDDFNSDDDSDNDVLQIDFNSTAQTEGDEEYRQTPGGVSSATGSVIPTPAEDEKEEIVINLNEDVPIDPDTCLALNKAYQEVLLDTLRSIEMALIENREKQDKIYENMATDNPKKTKTSDGKKRTVTSYNRPFFLDQNGNVPPTNTDVIIKRRTDEIRQDIRPLLPWRKKTKNLLLEAVYLDSLDQQTRPLLNRKEIYFEKLSKMSKEANGEDYDTMVEKIENIDEEIKKFSSMPKEEILLMSNSKRIDWMKIANTSLNNIRDAYECELYWNSVMKPSINKQDWTKKEKENLKKLAEKYNQKNWPAIAKELGTNRTAFQCLQYYQQNYNEVFQKKEWTEYEDQSLLEVVEHCRVGLSISWTQVSYFMDGRNSNQCALRYSQINPEVKRGKWSEEEDMKLLSAVYMYGEKEWEKISEFVPSRTVYQCRERYKSSLDPRLLPPDVWSYEEDKHMMELCNMLRKPDGRVAWARVAEKLHGRSDNMVLCRHKKLMEWKEKCDWLEKQSPKHKQSLGYISLDELAMGDRSGIPKESRDTDDKPTEADYKRLLHKLSKLPVSEYKFDYVKQLRDKHEGNIVVPRPPLMYRYTRRNVVNIWARKKHMKTLLELHLAKLNITRPEDRILVPEKTAEEFKPFSLLDKKQIDKVQRVLQTKHPCEISVKEIIELATEDKIATNEICQVRRAKNNRVGNLIEKRICDILQYKHCYITKWRKPSGRPKKFYIFYPGGRKPNSFEPENTVQLSTVTSTLLLNALEVDGKSAVNMYHSFLPKKRKILKPLLEILVKCFPHLSAPPPKPTTIIADSETTLDGRPKLKRGRKPRKKRRPKKRQFGIDEEQNDDNETHEEIEELSKVLDSIVDKARIKTRKHAEEVVKVKQEIMSPQKNSGTKRKSGDKPNEATAPKLPKTAVVYKQVVSSAASSTAINAANTVVVPLPSRTTTTVAATTSTMPRIVKLNQTSAGPGPVPTALIMNTSVNRPGQCTMLLPNMVAANTLKPGQKMPASNPRVIVINKPPTAAGQNRFPILPPCVTTMRGYEEFLIQSNLLKSRAGEKYNPFFYHEKSVVLKQRLDEVKTGNNSVSNLDFNDKVDRALEHGAKRVNAILCGRGVRLEKAAPTVHPKKDLLKDIRKTEEYIKLKKRFDALFLWPAFLSLLRPNKENIFDKQEQDKKLITFDEYMETVEEKEKREAAEMREVTEQDVAQIKIKKEKDEQRRQRAIQAFHSIRQKRLAKKNHVSRVRRLAKQYQMKSLAEKGIDQIRAEKKAREEAKVQRKLERYKHLGQRSRSQRVIKQRIIESTKPKELDIPKKLRSMQIITREMEREKTDPNYEPQEGEVFGKRKYKKRISKTADKAIGSDDLEPEADLPAGFFMTQNTVGMVPVMSSPGSQGTSTENLPSTSGVVPMILQQQIAATSTKAGLTQQPSVQTSSLAPQGVVQPLFLMQQSASTSSGMPTFIMPDMTGTAGTTSTSQGIIPVVVGQNTELTTGTASLINNTSQQTGVIPIVVGQNSEQTTGTASLINNTSQQTGVIPIVVGQNSEQTTGTTSSVNQNNGATQAGIIPVVAGQNRDETLSGAASVSTNVTPETMSNTSPTKSQDSPDKSDMSHVFLGTAPGQEGTPILISVPKDSNMTVKELIQMMGKGGDNSSDIPMEVDSSEKTS